jgi:hypothetical protein
MNKGPKLIAVLVVIFMFSIQLLVFDSYQSSVFNNNNNNDDDDDNNNNDDDDDNNDGKFEAKVCEKLLDSETCKKIADELKSSTKKLSKEEIQAEGIRSKYLEPSPPLTTSPPPPTTSPPPPTTSPPPLPSSLNTTNSSSTSLSLANLNTLDQNQLIDAISSKISQLRTFEKNKISQALFDLTQSTAAKGGDVMNSLRQIGTKILQNPSDPLVDRIIGLAQTK